MRFYLSIISFIRNLQECPQHLDNEKLGKLGVLFAYCYTDIEFHGGNIVKVHLEGFW